MLSLTTALYVTGTFYIAMVVAGYVIELLFGVTELIPAERRAKVVEAGITWNYTTWRNIAFLLLGTALIVRFLRTGGVPMLRMMGGRPDADHADQEGRGATGHSHGTYGDGHHDARRDA